ncbi:MAG: chloramphenicol resistance protein, partial [Myxococcota bacterium]
MIRALATCSLLLISTVANAQTRVGPADDVEAAINSLGPGDELILEDGMYELSSRFAIDIAGTADNPIVIRAADGANPHLDRPGQGQNIIDIENAEHVILRGLE